MVIAFSQRCKTSNTAKYGTASPTLLSEHVILRQGTNLSLGVPGQPGQCSQMFTYKRGEKEMSE